MSDKRIEELDSMLYASKEHTEYWQARAEDLTVALRVAVDDLYKAANQFAGLKSNVNNADIFRSKAIRAEKVLNK